MASRPLSSRALARSPAGIVVGARRPGRVQEADTEPASAPRVFTIVVDRCPTGSPGGATIAAAKADGRARALGGE